MRVRCCHHAAASLALLLAATTTLPLASASSSSTTSSVVDVDANVKLRGAGSGGFLRSRVSRASDEAQKKTFGWKDIAFDATGEEEGREKKEFTPRRRQLLFEREKDEFFTTSRRQLFEDDEMYDLSEEDMDDLSTEHPETLAALTSYTLEKAGFFDDPHLQDFAVQQEQQGHRRDSKMIGEEKQGDAYTFFKPLACNANLETACTTNPQSFATYVQSASESNDQVIIPCGSCAVVDLTGTVDLPKGLTVRGKLIFPSTSSITVRTPHVIVEGEFKIDSPTSYPIPGPKGGYGVKFVFTGTDDVFFVPHESNAEVCGGAGEDCDVGTKAFVVAGGKLDIQGMDPACPSWERLLDTSSTVVDNVPVPTKKLVPDPPAGCSRILVDEDFSATSKGYTSIGKSSILQHGGTNQGTYIRSTKRELSHGPAVYIDPACIVPNQPYIVTGRARLISRTKMTPPYCTKKGTKTHCLDMHGLLHDRKTNLKLGGMVDAQANLINEGEWFDFTFNMDPMTPEQIARNWGGKSFLLFSNVEAGVDIDMDYVKVSLPPAEILPSPDQACLDLVVANGDAETPGVGPWPFSSPVIANYLTVEKEENGNSFFRYRRYGSSFGMWYRFAPGCLQPGVVYKVKMRWRLHWEAPSTLTLRFRHLKASGEWGEPSYFGECPKASSATGWVDCEVDFAPTREMMDATLYELWTFPEKAPQGVIDYDDIHIVRTENTFKHIDKIIVSPEAAACWAPGAELVLTSNTYHDTDKHVVKILSTEPATGTITLTEPIKQTTSVADDPDFAVEVALLNRNVVFEPESNRDLIGGHLMVLQTPDVVQKIQGIEFKHFGQQGRLGRYPIHLHLCESAPGSVISKNLVRESNQRGVVIHGTHEVTIEENVAFDVFGHCYFLEDGSEVENVFRRNLGVGIKRIPVDTTDVLSATGGREESDNSPSVFWISNPQNYFYGNVAAGSEKFGFWIETHSEVRGPSAALHGSVQPDRIPLGAFKDNVAHSSKRFGFTVYPPLYLPSEETVVENFRCYRNYDVGLFLHVVHNMKFVGGLVADNGEIGVRINRGDNITFDGTRIIGMSPNLRNDVLPKVHSGRRCPGDGDLTGLSFHPTRIDFFETDGNTRGLTLKNVDFSHFNTAETGCASGTILYMEKYQVIVPVFDNPTTFIDVTIDPGAAKIGACASQEFNGLNDAIVEDIGGGFSPSGTPGFMVSPSMTIFTNTECTSMGENSCMHYCEGVCLRTVTFRTSNAASTEGFQMIVTNGDKTMTIDRHGQDASSPTQDSMFGVSLPAGNFDVSFHDKNGALAWPEYVVPIFEAPPSCSDHLKPESVNIIRPDATPDRCGNDLINNGNFESGHIDGWQSFWSDVEFTLNGENSPGAVQTIGWGWITQWIDVSCLVLGEVYDLTASYRLVDEAGENFACASDCPELHMAYYHVHRGDPNKWPADEWQRVGQTSTYLGGQEWNHVGGSITITPSIAEADKVQLVMRHPNHGDYRLMIDNVSMTRTGFEVETHQKP